MSATVRPALAAALALVVAFGAVGAQGQGSRRERDRDYRRADPGAVIAAELAFARAAQEKGQWTAFAEYATKDAVMFVPEPVNAQDWLKRQTNPPQAVRWQPHQVWSSCDGSLALTKGAWQRADGSAGYFTTVWQRQGKKGKTEYRWVMDQGDVLAEPLLQPEMIEARTADCSTPSAAPLLITGARIGGIHEGKSEDGTLHWQVVTPGDGSRSVSMHLWDGTGWQDVLLGNVAAAP